MHFPIAVALAALPFLVGGVPVQNSLRDVITIPLSKRLASRNADGVVNTANLQASIHHTLEFVFPVLFRENGGFLKRCLFRKYQRGFEAFKRNTGTSHPLASKHSDKRSDARAISISVPLTKFDPDPFHMMWTGTIEVGTPAAPFSGLSLFREV
jgi:hypothetical protein